MKKFALFVSMLALSACGGGSGGNIDARDAAIASNENITKMNSFVIIGDNTSSTTRSGATNNVQLSDGTIQYDLENVTFKSIPGSGVIANLVFHTDDNGKIVSFEYPDAEELMAQGNCDITVGPIERQGDTNVFVEHAVLDEEFGELAGQVANIPYEYISYAKDLGLKYSDFGIVKSDIASTGIPELEAWGTQETPFAGGYDIKNVNNTAMNTLAQDGDIIFTGLAKGQVSYHDWDAGIGGASIALPGGLTDNAATLTFAQDGTQTLAANFPNWARIEAVKAVDNTNQFTVHESYIDDTSRWYLEPGSHAGLNDGQIGEHGMAFQTGYYGDDGNPTEGVALLQYQYQSDFNPEIDDYNNHINLDLGFGGTR